MTQENFDPSNRHTMQPISELWPDASAELLYPFPSICLPDWPHFNEVTGGLRPNEFTILCGPTGCGKTTFLANLSMQLLLKTVPHFVASVETGHTDFIKRVMSAFRREDWNTGESISADLLKDFFRSYENILKSNDLILSLYEDRFSVETLMNDLETARTKHGCKIAMIDNLNFILDVTTANQQIVEMDRVVHSLIMFCKKIGMHIIMVMHPKKTDGGRVESEFDIKGSSTAVQEAHNVLLFNRPTTADEQRGYDRDTFRELKIAKLRRRGKYVFKRIMFRNMNSYYAEDSLL